MLNTIHIKSITFFDLALFKLYGVSCLLLTYLVTLAVFVIFFYYGQYHLQFNIMINKTSMVVTCKDAKKEITIVECLQENIISVKLHIR